MAGTESSASYAIEFKGITKSFGTVVANNDIDLSVKKGEILALLGENGSGKTTLMNMLSGIYHPDSGFIFVNGKQAAIHSPKDAASLGIGMIHQHVKLVDVYTALENILIGQRRTKRISKKELKKHTGKISKSFGMNVDLDKKIYDMSIAEKQTVEILKVLCRGADILILDEPTAVLTPQEIKKLFVMLRRMRDEGCAIIIITHKLGEVMEISDRVAILRKGEMVGEVRTSKTSVGELTELMVGRAVNLSIERISVEEHQPLLRVRNLTAPSEQHGVDALQDVSFTLNTGEILGVAGIAGSGQREFCEAIAGLHPISGGSMHFHDRDIVGCSPAEISEMGISMSFIPEDRLGMGLVACMGMTDNMLLKSYRAAKGIFLDRRPAKKLSQRLIKELSIVTPGTEVPVRQLSGGNVQKVLLGREIQSNPSILITAYPVRGLDIHSSHTIYDLLNEQKRRGVGVLYIGEDLDVLLELCDRILVLCQGKVSGIVDAKTATKEQIGLLMTGVIPEEGVPLFGE